MEKAYCFVAFMKPQKQGGGFYERAPRSNTSLPSPAPFRAVLLHKERHAWQITSPFVQAVNTRSLSLCQWSVSHSLRRKADFCRTSLASTCWHRCKHIWWLHCTLCFLGAHSRVRALSTPFLTIWRNIRLNSLSCFKAREHHRRCSHRSNSS